MYNKNLYFHFIGIGGSGMSGIAEILLELGYQVSGSDLVQSAVTERLQAKGAIIKFDHRTGNIPKESTLVVYSSAVTASNPEIIEAKKRNLPIVRRAEVLAELMRLKYGVAVAGSHGKTTTTSMLAAILEQGGLDPTVIIGGKVKTLQAGSKLGTSEHLVAESDESDRSFLLLKPTIAIVTNIDTEHMDSYESENDLEKSFYTFLQSVPFYGLSIICTDCDRVRKITEHYNKRKITYGFKGNVNYTAKDIRQKEQITSYFLVKDDVVLGEINLPLPGTHFVLNSLAAIAAANEFGVGFADVKQALESFSGVERRLELIGVKNNITVINDYGHHPTEIKASLKAVRDGWKNINKLHVVFQPHRYSRTRDCFLDFVDAFLLADNLITTEIYAASEAAIPGISGSSLNEQINHNCKTFIASHEEILENLQKNVNSNELVLFLGAGSVGSLPSKYLELI